MTIKLYEEKYRDDLIFTVLQAKDALGRKPTIYSGMGHSIKGTIRADRGFRRIEYQLNQTQTGGCL